MMCWWYQTHQHQVWFRGSPLKKKGTNWILKSFMPIWVHIGGPSQIDIELNVCIVEVTIGSLWISDCTCCAVWDLFGMMWTIFFGILQVNALWGKGPQCMCPFEFYSVADGRCLWAPGWFFDEFQNCYLDVIFPGMSRFGEMCAYWFVLVTSFDVPKVTNKPVH